MDFSKLPPSLLVALGLVACVENKESTSTDGSTGPCLSPPMDSGEISTSACLEPPIDTTTGPCLSTVGPCLGAVTTGTGTETGTETGTDTEMGTGTDTDPTDGSDTGTSGSDTGTTGNGAAVDTRDGIVNRLAEKGILPPDVISRLQGRSGG